MQTLIDQDETIRRTVCEQLAGDARVEPSDISVRVRDGKVWLSGSVPRYLARELAEVDAAMVPGVVAVENEIAVKYPATVDVPEDRRIEENIRNLIRYNSGIDERKISVAVALGTVVLEGTVSNFWQKVKAEALTAEVRGAASIHNKLSVVPTTDVFDEVIAQDITAAVDRTLGADLNVLNVSVEHGVVTLSGSVPDLLMRRAAEEIAQRTTGVREVHNNLVIAPAPQD
jgi:osmotically-inducible protein OsmY